MKKFPLFTILFTDTQLLCLDVWTSLVREWMDGWGGLNESGTHRLTCLNIYFPVGGATVWEGLGTVALLEKGRHWVGFEVPNDSDHPC